MKIRFVQSSEAIERYDFVEVTALIGQPVADPFRSVIVRGIVKTPGGAILSGDGFCDSHDGSVHRIRFLATETGEYSYHVTVEYGDALEDHQGAFSATDAGRKGLLRTDGFYFQWEGTGEHFFYNSTTAYHMVGLREDVLSETLERLAHLGVNRVRCCLSPPRTPDGQTWFEPVYPSDEFTFLFGPWLCARPESPDDPGIDVTRFDIPFWQKFEILAWEAMAQDIVVSVIFYTDGRRDGAYPFPRDQEGGNEDEERYYRYAAARLGAFANVTWDVTNEWKLFRTDAWAETMGMFLKSCDPYKHLTTVHGHGEFPFRTSAWADFAQFQVWDEHGGYDWMFKQRREQAATGRIIPQVNEEYGYENHYPGPWGEGRVAPTRAADTRRRLAWEHTMAGCHQTTGERVGDNQGGWLNGRGDDSMTMLHGYKLLKDFFTAFDWWKMEPMPELAGGKMCLAEPGVRYVVYLPEGGDAEVETGGASLAAVWYNPRTGETSSANRAPSFTAPDSEGDWVLHLYTESA